MLHSTLARLETKFVADAATGEFEGYAAVFNNQDAHGDVIKPGAFKDTLEALKSAGRSVPMYANHGPSMGGDTLPVGVWVEIAEDDHGLKVKGRISSMDTDYGRRIYGLVKDGALGGLSIGFNVAAGGATYGQKSSEPKRTLTKLDLGEISLVDAPSNARSRVTNLKTAALSASDRDSAAGSIAAAMRMHDKNMKGETGYGHPDAKDKALMMDHLRDAHEALTGLRAPDGLDGWTKRTELSQEAKSAFADLRSALGNLSLTS